jgi:hypothetical protein
MKWQLRQLAIVAAMVLAGCATTYPIKDEKAAIAVAMEICHESSDQALHWKTTERADGAVWLATQLLPDRTSYVVQVPTNGPFPAEIVRCNHVPVPPPIRPQF